MNSVHGLEEMNSDIIHLENCFGHECEAGVKEKKYYNGRYAMPKKRRRKKGRPDYCFTH